MMFSAKEVVTLILAGIALVCILITLLGETIQPKLYVRCLMSDNTVISDYARPMSWLFSTMVCIVGIAMLSLFGWLIL